MAATGTLKKTHNMTKDEIKEKVAEMIDSAWEFGFAQGANETSATYMDKLKEKQKAIEEAYNAGYVDGHKAALAGVNISAPTEDEVEGGQTETVKYDMENEAVKAYMADRTYYANGFATGKGLSVVDKYIQGAKEGNTQSWTERPASCPTELAPFYDENGVEVPMVNGICNLIPGRKYTYKAKNGGKGVLLTTGHIRMITTADVNPVVNIRDIGGYTCEGGHVAYGKLIRSATLKELKKGSVNAQVIENLGVTLEISLSSSNPARTDLKLWGGKNYSCDAYVDFLTKTKLYPSVKKIFQDILTEAEAGGCVLLHCYAGTARTGTIAATLLGLLGVSEGDIIKDWEMTSMCCWFNRKRISDWETREIVRQECPNGELRQFFQKIKATYGTNGETFQKQCEAFLKVVGLTSAQLDRLKKNLIEK